MQLHNTLTKARQEFTPIHKGKVGLYTCGPTVYDFAHIGNWRAYIFADTLRRVLEFSGYEVRHITNITDVGHLTADDIAQGDSGDDKMVKKALAEKKTPSEIADFYEDYFHSGSAALNILPSHYYPRATAHIPQIIKMVEELIENGHAYVVNGAVFYDVTSFAAYGNLSGNTLENLKSGARLEEHPDKRNPWDFALWLPAPKEHLMRWQSPWSEGYPGWHIECSAMSQEYLGDVFDIHTGGEDHIFPHHEAEIAQTCGVTHKPVMANFFVHLRHMLIDGQKMSKSKGNFYTLEDIYAKGFDAMDLRMVFLQAHYRSQMNFTWESLEQARKNKLSLFAIAARLGVSKTTERLSERAVTSTRLAPLLEALQDDLNTPLALALALELATEDNKLLDTGAAATNEQRTLWQAIFFLFGLRYEPLVIPEAVMALAEARQAARAAKDFAESDALRDQITAAGYSVKDTATGYEITKL
jgi:cysteinyl-tRNA synthetase